MKALWIRVEAHESDSMRIAQLAESLGIDPILALGHYVALGGAVAEHTEDGHIANVPNATIERWARWSGRRGSFATAVREILQDGEGFLDNWRESMGKLIERRANDRKRIAEKRQKEREQSDDGRQNDGEQSDDRSGTDRGLSGATGRDGTGPTAKTTTRPPENSRGVDKSERAARADQEPPDPNSFRGVMALVRERLYVPDGQPPADWDEARDGSILKALHETYSYLDIGAAVAGLALLRDHPGKYGDVIDWLPPKNKATLRALYNTNTGVLTVFTAATNAYWKHVNAMLDATEPS